MLVRPSEPQHDATTAALFAGQLKDPAGVIIVKGWPAGSGQALTEQLVNGICTIERHNKPKSPSAASAARAHACRRGTAA